MFERFGKSQRLFGEVGGVFAESLRNPRVDVHAYTRRGSEGREVCSLVTSGMSDREMAVPAGAETPLRVELIFYCTEAC